MIWWLHSVSSFEAPGTFQLSRFLPLYKGEGPRPDRVWDLLKVIHRKQ